METSKTSKPLATGGVLKFPCHKGKRKNHRNSCSISVRADVEFPDLALYSQPEELSNGATPTWDNPDFDVSANESGQLNREIKFRVQNKSASVAALHAKIHLHLGVFGIDMPMTEAIPMITRSFDPASEQEFTVMISDALIGPRSSWSTLRVLIDHERDQRLINNSGSWAVKRIPVNFADYKEDSIPVRNSLSIPRTVSFELSDDFDGSLQCVPQEIYLEAGATQSVQLKVKEPFNNAPSTGSERRNTSIIAKDEHGNLVGGVTYSLLFNP